MNIKKLSKDIQLKGYIKLHDQVFDESEYISLMKKFGECETPGLFMNPKEHPEIFLVTGKRYANGVRVGMFGDKELGWHCNGSTRPKINKILVGLYCIKEDINTTLSICNTSDPFYELSKDDQEYWRSIKIQLKYKNNVVYQLEDEDPELEFTYSTKGSIRKLVGVHPYCNKEYFYFPYQFICKAWKDDEVINHEVMIEKLKKIIFRSKYQTHHIFKEGDLILMDQFTSIHRRTPVLDNTRLLWRIACDYSIIEN